MILDVPYQYKIDGTLEGRLSRRDHLLWESERVHIRSVSGSDAPVCVRWNGLFPDLLAPDPHAPKEWGTYCADGDAHTVHFDNSHWVALNTGDNMREPPWANPAMVANDLALSVNGGDCRLLGLEGFDKRARQRFVEGDGTSLFDSIERSGRDTAKRKLHSLSDRLLLVEGRLYAKCDEPRIWIMKGTVHADRVTAGNGFDVAIVRVATNGKQIVAHRNLQLDRRETFGLGEVDHALALARSFNEEKRYGAEADAMNEASRPIVEIDRGFDADANLYRRLREHGVEFNSIVRKIAIGDMPRQTNRLILDLQDALEILDTQTGIDAFETAAFGLHDALSDRFSRHHNLSLITGEMVALLDSREVTLGDALSTNRMAP